MNYIQHFKNILNQEELDLIITKAEKAGFKPAPVITDINDVNGNDYRTHHKPNQDFFKADKVFMWEESDEFKSLESFFNKLINRLLKNYLEKQPIENMRDWEIHYFSVVKYKEGGYFRLHQDTIWQPDGLFKSLSILIYLSDFEGGSLLFPQTDIELSMEKGDAIVFPAGPEYKHIANEVTKGTKYVLTLWPLVKEPLNLTRD